MDGVWKLICDPFEDLSSFTSSSLSYDGDVIAIGEPYLETTPIGGMSAPYKPGGISIYRRGDNGWSLDNQIIITSEMSNSGVADGYSFGRNVSISSDGNRLAISAPSAFKSHSDGSTYEINSGAVYIYDYVSGQWQQKKIFRLENFVGKFFGYTLSLSGDGNTLVAQTKSSSDGYLTKVYKLNSGEWEEVFSLTRDGEPTSISALSTNYDGSVFGFSYKEEDENSWLVEIYEYSDNTYKIRDKAISQSVEKFGMSVDLDSLGNSIAVSSRYDDLDLSSNSGKGIVKVYKYEDDVWKQVGNTLTSSENSNFGNSISLSNKGDFLLVDAPNLSESESLSSVKSLENNNSWVKLADDILLSTLVLLEILLFHLMVQQQQYY